MTLQNRILAVDDNPINLAILQALLDEDYCLTMAESGEQALRIASEFRPDVVLLDIMMPGIDGYETCRRLRQIPALRHTKVIMVSAKAMLNERLEGYQVGADDYVTKPFDHDELLAKIRVFLRLKSVEEVEQVKGRLIDVLQHSTRAPLAALICNAELLVDCPDLAEQPRLEIFQSMLRSARRLGRVLEKGETLAAMKSHKFTFDFHSADYCALIHNVLTELQSGLSDRGILCELDVPDSAIAAMDQQQMEFVIRALLENAIRFSPDGGTITIELSDSKGELVLQVSDQGHGIVPDLLPSVFEEFANPESPLHNQGDGLSLAIVREIVSSHGGSVHAASDTGGATFTVRVPSHVSPEPVARASTTFG